MPSATTVATPAALLAAWEAPATPAQLAAQAPHRAAVLVWLTALHQLIASALPLPGNVDMDDIYTVVRSAGAMRAAQTETAGPTRAAEALRQLVLPVAIYGQPARRALLFIASGTTAPLEMDELSEITETIHTTLLHDEGEMIFGHSEQVAITNGAIQVWLLLAYQA